MKLPDSTLLVVVVFWLIFAAFSSLVWTCFTPASLAEAAGAFFIKLIVGGFAGGLSAGFLPIQWLSWIAVAVFIVTQVFPSCRSLLAAQLSLGAFMLLSFLTFWVDELLVSLFSSPFSSAFAEAMAGKAVSYMLRFLQLPSQLVVNGVWVFAWVLIGRELHSEGSEAQRRHQHQQQVDALLQDAFTPRGPMEPPVQAVLVADIPCTVCQHPTRLTQRFCSRCGTPVRPPAAPGSPH